MNWKLIRLVDASIGIPLVFLLRGYRALVSRWRGNRLTPSPRRVLFVKFWGIGNIFMLLPAVHAMREQFPSARLDLLTLRSNKEAADTLGMFDHTYAIDTRSVSSFLRTCVTHYHSLAGNDYDLIIDFEQFARFSAIFCALVGRGTTIGFDTAGQHRHALYSLPVRYSNTRHVAKSFFSLVVEGGARLADYSDSVRAVSLGRRAGPQRNFLTDSDGKTRPPILVVHMGTSTNFSERRWPTRHYAALIDRLTAHSDVRIVCTGLSEETPIVREVMDRVQAPDSMVDVTGRLSFPEFFDLILGSDLVLSADTSAVHIASAFGIAVVGLYGPNTPLLYGPWGEGGVSLYSDLPCSPCITNFNAKTHDCRHPGGKGTCMSRIAPEDVYDAVREILFDRTHEEAAFPNRGAEACIP